jgi:Tfp pilus assembly protein PilN
MLLIKMPFVGQSQISDTICIQVTEVKKLLTKAEEGKLLGEKVILLNNQIALLDQRIIEKSQMVAAYEQINTENDSLIASYKKEILLMTDQRKILEQAIKEREKEIKRYKRKLFWRTAGGVMLVGAGAYLYLTK